MRWAGWRCVTEAGTTTGRGRRCAGTPAQARGQAVDVVAAAVDAEGGAAGGRQAEALVQRLGAVVAGADGHRLAVEQRGDVVGVGLRQREGDDAGPLGGRARAVDARCRAPRAAAPRGRTR